MDTDQGASPVWMTGSELARSASVNEAFVQELTILSILEPDERGYAPTDVYRVRFAMLVTQSGIGLGELAQAKDAGIIAFGDLDVLFPDPVRATGRTYEELAADLGVEPQSLARVRLAAGLAAQRPEDTVQSDEEQILRLILTLADAFGDKDLATRIARVYGERTQRIAASALSMHDEYVRRPMIESGARLDGETSRRSSKEDRWLMDRAEELLMALYRRHFDSGLLSGWVQTSEALMARHGVLPTRPKKAPAIGFVDLSGFTKITEEKGDEEGTRLATQLVVEAERAAAAHGSHIVKLLGDGVMLHGDEPGPLIETALQLVESLPAAGLPPARAGVHAGPLIERDGDYFGHTVNVAARIADEASAGEVLASASAIEGASDDIRLTELPVRELRGVRETIRIYRVARA